MVLPPRADRTEELLAEVELNGRRGEAPIRVFRRGQDFYLVARTFDQFRLRRPSGRAIHSFGEELYALRSSGITTSFDEPQQLLRMNAPANAFLETKLDLSNRYIGDPTAPPVGLFLNHDFQLTRSLRFETLSGLVEMGLFSRLGVLTTRWVDRNVFALDPVRLDTQFVRDFPSKMMTLTVGDAMSEGSTWGRQLPYAGVRFASKFSTRPDFIPFALPSLRGQVAQPSTVDIFVNGVRTGHESVDSGPFTLQDIPVMTGQGDIRMTVTDVLGRQQIVTRSYLADQQILRRGVSSYTVDTGVLRRNYGYSSYDYGQWFASGEYTRGITDSLTLVSRGEFGRDSQAIGVASNFAILPMGSFSVGGAISHSNLGNGGFLQAQFNRRSRAFGFGGSIQTSTIRFSRLGDIIGFDRERLVTQAQISRSISRHTSLSVGHLYRSAYGSGNAGSQFQAVTTSLNRQIGTAFLTVSGNYSPSDPRAYSAGITLVIPLGAKTMIASSNVQDSGVVSNVEMTKQLPVGNGFGYRVRTTTANFASRGIETGLSYQNDLGTYGVEAAFDRPDTAVRLSETGSLILIDKELIFSRWLSDSFALVKVDGANDLPVFANNHLITRTGRRGTALVPHLVPYDANTIRLGDEGLPVEFNADFSDRTIVPMPRSGVLVRFSASRNTGAVLQLLLEDGSPVPLGAEVQVTGSEEIFHVAFRGEVFIPRVLAPMRVEVRWGEGSCTAFIKNLPVDDALPRIPVHCGGSQ